MSKKYEFLGILVKPTRSRDSSILGKIAYNDKRRVILVHPKFQIRLADFIS